MRADDMAAALLRAAAAWRGGAASASAALRVSCTAVAARRSFAADARASAEAIEKSREAHQAPSKYVRTHALRSLRAL